LCAAKEEDIDPALAGKVEELPRAVGERVALALVQEGQPQVGTLLLEQKRAGRRNGRGSAYCNMPRITNQSGDYAGEKLFFGVHTNSSR